MILKCMMNWKKLQTNSNPVRMVLQNKKKNCFTNNHHAKTFLKQLTANTPFKNNTSTVTRTKKKKASLVETVEFCSLSW